MPAGRKWSDPSQDQGRANLLGEHRRFLKYVPHNLHGRLDAQLTVVERELQAGTSFMNARGLLHFDAHFWNILTDGERLYFADYGLAISSDFDLSQDEKRFFAEHQAYDRRCTVTHLVLWLRAELQNKKVPPRVAAMLQRHAPVADAMTDF